MKRRRSVLGPPTSGRPWRVAGWLGVALLALSPSAVASGISVARFGGEQGHPTTDNPTAIYYNPAGIALSHGTHLFADAGLAWRRSRYERSADPRDAPVPPGGEGANTGEGQLDNWAFSPMGGATHRLGDVVVGLAAYTPFGGQSQWSQNDAFAGDARFPGAVDGVQRWYSINGELRSTFFSAAGAYDFGRVQVGLSANLVWSVVNTLRARDPGGSNRLGSEGRSWIDASSWDPSFGVGVVGEPLADRLWLGLSYQSMPNVVGGLELEGDLRTVFASGSRSKSPVAFHTEIPDVLRAGGRYRPTSDVELRLFADYQRWSVLDDHCVSGVGEECAANEDGSAAPGTDVILNQVRDWNDTVGVRVGGSLWATPAIEVFAGGGFSSNAIPDETLEPALQDYDSFSAALGGRFRLADSLHLAASYTQVIYLSRDTSGQSIHPDLLGPTGAGSPSQGPPSGGRYSQQLGLINVNVDVAF